MKFNVSRFGEIEVKPEEIITFPDGLLGFSDCIRFTFINSKKIMHPYKILQSLDTLSLAFPMMSPLILRPDYKFSLNPEELKLLKVTTIQNLEPYCTVNLSEKIENSTINLQGPFIINPKENIGHQCVLSDSDYSHRDPLNPDQTPEPDLDENPFKF